MGLYVVTIPCYCRLGFVHPDSHASFQPDETSRRERDRKVSVLRLKLTSFYLFSFSAVSCTAACSRAALGKKQKERARGFVHWGVRPQPDVTGTGFQWLRRAAGGRAGTCRRHHVEQPARAATTRDLLLGGEDKICVYDVGRASHFSPPDDQACERRGDVVKSAWVCSRYMKYRKPPLRWRRCRHERPTSPHRT